MRLSRSFHSMSTRIESLQRYLDEALEGVDDPRILEAGCGSLSHLSFPRDARVTGIDISQSQLDRNPFIQEKICADIQKHRFAEGTFHAIVCWDVLEHLRAPEQALENLFAALRTGGMMILALPHVRSLKGLITRFTPHAFHVWVYRRILRDRDAGRNDRAPFRTYHRSGIAPAALERWAGLHQADILMLETYRNEFVDWVEERNVVLRQIWRMLQVVVRAVSFQRIDVENTDVLFVLRKA